MKILIVLACGALLSCGTNPEWVQSNLSKQSNRELLRNYEGMKQMESQMIFGVPKHMRMQKRLMEEEIQRRGITGAGLPAYVPIDDANSNMIHF